MMADLSALDSARRAWFESKQAMIRARHAWICMRCCYFWWPWTDQTGLHGPDCCASLISVVDRHFFTNLSPKWWPTGACNGPNLALPAKWVAPLGAPPLPKRTSPVRAGFAVRDPTQTDRFGPLRTPKGVGRLKMPSVLQHPDREDQFGLHRATTCSIVTMMMIMTTSAQ
jgi:hypothetical protein